MDNSIRDVGFLKWKDARAWMERMRGPAWKALVAEEQGRWEQAVRSAGGKEEVEAAIAMFDAAKQENDVESIWTVKHGAQEYKLLFHPGRFIQWWLASDPAERPVRPFVGDIEFGADGLVYVTEDSGKGGEHFVLRAYRRDTSLWSFKGVGAGGIGRSVCAQGDRIFCLEADEALQYRRLVSLRAGPAGGKDRRVILEEKNPSVAFELIPGENRCLFLLAEAAGRQALWHIPLEGEPVRLSPRGVSFLPVGCAPGYKEPCYFVREGSFSSPWIARGEPLASWKLPASLGENGLEGCWLRQGLLVQKIHGERILFHCGRRRAPRYLQSLLGEVEQNPWLRWAGQESRDVKVHVPGVATLRGALMGDGLELRPAPSIYGGRRLAGFAESRDGTPVRWILCHSGERAPRAVIVCAYGAYGIPSTFQTTRWRPYIERGCAVAFACIRGGGDHNESWAEAGRREGKEKGVEDYEACIQAVQAVLELPPSKTCIYGRSAGGYVLGALVARHPHGDLFRCAYAEVPYVDVLRTASNPKLPLTRLEFDEFGDPAGRMEDFETILRLSPVDSLSSKGAPGVFVVCRTAKNDTQVYAYESFKWVNALRGDSTAQKRGLEKLVAMNPGQGHFTLGYQLQLERAEDFLLICKNLGLD